MLSGENSKNFKQKLQFASGNGRCFSNGFATNPFTSSLKVGKVKFARLNNIAK